MKDPYVYDNGTLKNKLNIKDHDLLKQAEADIGFIKLINVDSIEFDNFDEELLKKIHEHIFEDIFDWAGEYRTVPIYKEEIVIPGVSLNYASVDEIKKKLKNGLIDLNDTRWNLDDIDDLTQTFARKIAVLWKIHPFRDGNTRTFLSFSYIFAKCNGFPFDISLFAEQLNRASNESGNITNYSVRDRYVLASLEESNYPEVIYLASLFKAAMLKYNNEISSKKI